LDLVARVQLRSRSEVGRYFTRYAALSDWWFAPGLAEGRAALLAREPADPPDVVRWVVLLDWSGGELAHIRDFRHARYVMDSLTTEPL
jgi:RNA polymerase sigma-70 factor (ECF subfamily)